MPSVFQHTTLALRQGVDEYSEEELRFMRKDVDTSARRQFAKHPGVSVQLFSATSGEGVDTLLTVIRSWLDSEHSLSNENPTEQG